MTKDELIYELTRTFSETPGETAVFYANCGDLMIEPVTAVEVDTVDGRQRIVLS